MTPRHNQLISALEGLIQSAAIILPFNKDAKPYHLFNPETPMEYRLLLDDANDIMSLIRAEAALQEIKTKQVNSVSDIVGRINEKVRLGRFGAMMPSPEIKKEVSLQEFNDIVTTSIAVAQGANHMCAEHPTSAARQERIVVGAIVQYVMNQFNIKRA